MRKKELEAERLHDYMKEVLKKMKPGWELLRESIRKNGETATAKIQHGPFQIVVSVNLHSGHVVWLQG
jgi:hypothetical protein